MEVSWEGSRGFESGVSVAERDDSKHVGVDVVAKRLNGESPCREEAAIAFT